MSERIGIPVPPSRGVVIAAEYLAYRVQEDMGTNSGQTALYWHLISVINQHTEQSNDN